jgi:hypothetical protein
MRRRISAHATPATVSTPYASGTTQVAAEPEATPNRIAMFVSRAARVAGFLAEHHGLLEADEAGDGHDEQRPRAGADQARRAGRRPRRGRGRPG